MLRGVRCCRLERFIYQMTQLHISYSKVKETSNLKFKIIFHCFCQSSYMLRMNLILKNYFSYIGIQFYTPATYTTIRLRNMYIEI